MTNFAMKADRKAIFPYQDLNTRKNYKECDHFVTVNTSNYVPLSPSATKLIVGGMLGNRLTIRAGCMSDSDDSVDVEDRGRLFLILSLAEGLTEAVWELPVIKANY